MRLPTEVEWEFARAAPAVRQIEAACYPGVSRAGQRGTLGDWAVFNQAGGTAGGAAVHIVTVTNPSAGSM